MLEYRARYGCATSSRVRKTNRPPVELTANLLKLRHRPLSSFLVIAGQPLIALRRVTECLRDAPACTRVRLLSYANRRFRNRPLLYTRAPCLPRILSKDELSLRGASLAGRVLQRRVRATPPLLRNHRTPVNVNNGYFYIKWPLHQALRKTVEIQEHIAGNDS